MFGFSLTKLVVLAVIIVAVWHGFKIVGRLAAARDRDIEDRRNARRRAGRNAGERDGASASIETSQCATCGAYVAPGSDCGRSDCPYAKREHAAGAR